MRYGHTRRWAWLFALPFSVGFLLFQMLPVGLNFVQTLYLGPRFVGLSNYAAVLGSRSFQLALGNTARYLLLAWPSAFCWRWWYSDIGGTARSCRQVFYSRWRSPAP